MSIVRGSSLVSIGINGMAQASKDITRAFTQLASGKRINNASDDAAGLALSSSIETKLRILEKASQNLSNSSSILQTVDSTAQQVQDITGRLSELATQAANDTYSPEQRAALQQEFTGLTEELQRLGEAAGEPNLITLDNVFVDRDGGAPPIENARVQVGGFFYSNGLSLVKNVSLATPESSQAGLAAVDQLAQEVSQYRSAVIGSTQARIDSIQRGIAKEQEAGAESLARITDIDIAEATLVLLQNRIRLQSSAKLFSIGRSMDTDFIKSLLS